MSAIRIPFIALLLFVFSQGKALAAAYTWLFNGSTTESWTPLNMAGYSVSGSYLRLNPNNDPQLLSPNLGMQPSGINYLKMGLRNNGTDTHGEVFFSASGWPASQSRRGLFTVPSGGTFNNVVCRLDNIPNWYSPATIDQIRIDPVWNGSGGNDSILVDFIFLRYDLYVPNAPTITSVSPSGWTNGPITVYFESNDPSDYSGAGPDAYGSGVDYFRYRVDPQADANVYPTWTDVWSGLTRSSITYQPGQLAAGANYFHVYCFDRIQRVSSDTKTWLYYDPQAPTVPGSVTATPNPANVDAVVVSWSPSTDYGLSGVNRYEWSINGVNGSTTGSSVGVPASATNQGDNLFFVRAVDNAGNASGYGQVSFLLDTQAPTAPSSATVTPLLSKTNSFAFAWTAGSDNVGVASYSYRVNSGSRTSTPWNVYSVPAAAIPNIVEGTNYFDVRTVDAAGNVSADTRANFVYDTHAPTVPTNVTVTPPSSTVNSFAISWTASTDATSGVKDYLWSINGGQELATTATSLPASSYGSEGLNTVAIKARDNAGNVSSAATATFTYTSPPIPSHIVLSVDSLRFVAPPYGMLPDTQYLIISNSGGGDMRFDVNINVPWLSYQGPLIDEGNYFALPLYINTSELAESTYTGTVTVTSSNADNSPQTVSVTYHVATVYASSTCTRNGEAAAAIPAVTGTQYHYKPSPNGPITIYADRLVDCRTSNSTCIVSGNVNINKILYFSGDLTIKTSELKILGNGRAFVKYGGMDINLWEGSINWRFQDAILKDLVNPSLSKLNLGGVKLQISELNMLSDGVGVKGVFEFPNIAGVKGTQLSITSIQVTRSQGIRFAGSFNYPGPLALGPMSLRNLSMSVDNIGNNFSGGATVDVRFISLGGSWSVLSGKLNSVGLAVEVSPGVPLGASGLRLTGGNGSVDHLSDGKPLAITLGATLKGGFSIGGVSVLEFSKYQFTIQPPSFLEGRGDFKIFGRQFANMYAKYDKPKLSCGFDANIGGFYRSKFSAALENSRLTGSANGTLRIPELPSMWKWTKLSGKEIASVQTQLANNEVSGAVGIPSYCLWVPFAGRKCTPSRIGFKMEFKPQDNPPVHFWYGFNYDPLRRLFRRALPNGDVAEVFGVDSLTSSAWFMVHGLAGVVPSFQLVTPGGSVVDSTAAAFFRFDEDQVAFYIVDDPTPGDWQLQIPDANVGDFEIEGLMMNGAPRLTFIDPTATTTSAVLRWFDSDVDDNAHVNLFYDTDDAGFDGAQINTDSIYEDDSANTYLWNTAEVAPGTYHVYAVISDTSNAPYAVYAPGTITVVNSFGLEIPSNFHVEQTDSSLLASWDRVSDPVSGYIIHYSDDTATAVPTQTIACGDTNVVELIGLTTGRTYIVSVSSYDSAGHESELSAALVLDVRSAVANNPPQILSGEPADRAIVEQTYACTLIGRDVDNDPVQFIADSVPSGMTVVADQLTWVPDTLQLGPNLCRVIARDGRGGEDTLEFHVSVIDTAAFVGSIAFDRVKYESLSDLVIVSVSDIDKNARQDEPDSLRVQLWSTRDDNGVSLWLRETGANTGEFAGSATLSLIGSNPSIGTIWVSRVDTLGVLYQDSCPSSSIETYALWKLASCCTGSTGNVDCDLADGVDISDLSSLIDYLYISFTPLCCPTEANVDGDQSGGVDISDLSALIDYLYVNFTPPAACQ